MAGLIVYTVITYSAIYVLFNQKSNRQCRICLCAPSNAAVDELIKRLIIERRKMEDQSKSMYN